MIRNRELSTTHIFIILGILVFIAHYWNFRQFGLYEDDYIVSDGMSFTWAQIRANFIASIVSFERPVGFFTITFIPYLSAKAGGLGLLHLIGFLIVWLNAALVFLLIRNRFSQTNALLGAIIFVLFPGDTTKGLLIHALHLQQSLAYLLLACICYVKNKKTLSYALVILSLLTYESAILPFFAVPLLAYKWDKAIIKKIVIHLVVMMVILAVYTAIRLYVGDGRMVTMAGSPTDTAVRILSSMILGPAVSGLTFVIRPVTALRDFFSTGLSGYGYYGMTIILLVLAWSLLRLKSVSKPIAYTAQNAVLKMSSSIATLKIDFSIMSEEIVKTSKLALIGLIVVIISYALAFTHFPPIAITGRATSVHLASTIGWSFLGSGLLGLALQFGEMHGKRNATAIIIAIYFSLLALFHLKVQDDYVKSWKMQREFWREVVKLSPDMTEKTIIFFDKKGLIETSYIQTFSWAVPVTLEQIYSFPIQWERPPRVFPRPAESEVSVGDSTIRWQVPTARWWSYSDVQEKENIIFLQYENNSWVRKNEMTFSGSTFQVKKIKAGGKYLNFEEGRLYRDFFEN